MEREEGSVILKPPWDFRGTGASHLIVIVQSVRKPPQSPHSASGAVQDYKFKQPGRATQGLTSTSISKFIFMSSFT